MKNDRFLLGILLFIGVIVVAAIVILFTGIETATYLPEESPEAIVHNYALAVTRGDYTRAYGYLAEDEDKPTQTGFRSHFNFVDPAANAGLRVVSADIIGDEAVVSIEVVYAGSGPFDSGYTHSDNALLVLQEGVWKITTMPYPYWDFGWYQEK